MNILWVCNGPIKKYYESQGQANEGPSWIDGLVENFDERMPFKLGVCFPQNIVAEIEETDYEGIKYYIIPLLKNSSNKKECYIQYYKNVIRRFSPDIIHVWGTEFQYVLFALDAARECGLEENVVISIQGMCAAIERHYCAGLPEKIIKNYTFRDFIKRDNIFQQRHKYQLKATKEKEAILNIKYAVGRTDYDFAYVKLINPKVNYFHCNEILRPVFYKYRWKYENCEKYTLFMSQAYYPLKGCHFVLQALNLVKQVYPQVHLYIAGIDIVGKLDDIHSSIRRTSYGKYLKKIIKKYKLEKNITFLGNLSQEEMCERYLKSNIFISASTTENESNSVSEAKVLGLPVIASLVGGISNRVVHKVDGYIYQYDDVFILASYICEIFQNPQIATAIGEVAHVNAMHVNDREKNVKQQVTIYEEIYKKIVM